MFLNDRIKKVCEVKQIRQIDLEKMGIASKQTINNIFRHRNQPTIKFVIMFLEKFNDINETWLLTGRGDIYKKNDTISYVEESTSSYITDIKDRYIIRLEKDIESLESENKRLKKLLHKKENK